MNNADSTEPEEHEYDIALSFLERDLGTAKEIYDALKERLEIFFYPAAQTDVLVGEYGSRVLSDIFRHKSRFVVVLFQDGWGDTDFTRIEQRAIEQRGFKGHDFDEFLIFLIVGPKEELPSWLPEDLIYHDALRFGVESAITTIENRMQFLGASVKPETAEELAARLDRKLQWQSTKRGLLNTHEGVARALLFAQELVQGLSDRVVAIAQSSTMLNLESTVGQNGRGIRVSLYSPNRPLDLVVLWHTAYANILEGAALGARIEAYPVRVGGERLTREFPEEIATREFEVDLLEPDLMMWREALPGEVEQYFSNGDLIDDLLRWLFEKFKTINPKGILY